MAQISSKQSIPAATVPRLSQYLRKLQEIQNRGTTTVSSRQLADEVGTNPAQIRKDLSYFGEFGIRGVGYGVDRLISELKKCLGLNHSWNVIIIGSGKLGTALALYQGFKRQGFNLIGMFDADSKVIGSDRGAGSVLAIDQLKSFLKQHEVHIAIVTTPSAAAQDVIDMVVDAGVPSVLNFASFRAASEKPVILRQVDLSTELMTLSFYLDK